MSEIQGTEEETVDVSPEERERWAMQDHIDTLTRELSHSKQREREARQRLDEIVDRLGETKRWWWF
jgi:hypothetical protein